jgi:hypothetical protein
MWPGRLRLPPAELYGLLAPPTVMARILLPFLAFLPFVGPAWLRAMAARRARAPVSPAAPRQARSQREYFPT